MAYEYVHASEYHRFKVDCADILKTTCARLKKEGISAVPTLIGSGGRNMVTRNGEGPYDLDYNLEIMKALPEHLNNLRGLKETVRVALNRSEGFECFDDAQDSTSCLTAILHFEDSPEVEFSFDVGIVRKNSFGDYERLIHNKYMLPNGAYYWNQVPQSHDLKKRERILKEKNLWQEVRDRYLYLKNLYLERQDHNHPSFVVYIEAVNQVFEEHR